MTRRERIINTLNYHDVDKLPKDLGGMASTGISCFAYKNLLEYLNLPARPIKVYDTHQMLGLPDADVLDALDCDVVTTNGYVTNAFNQDELWKDYDFNGRLEGGAVLQPDDFTVEENGTIVQVSSYMHNGKLLQNPPATMPASAVVFNLDHAGEPFDVNGELNKLDLVAMRKELDEFEFPDEEVDKIVAHCKKVRESTDRAVFFTGLNSALGFTGGMVHHSMMCALEPEYVHELHEIKTQFILKKYKKLFPKIAEYVDVVLIASEDMGTQQSLLISPDLIDELYMAYYKKVNDYIHSVSPTTKTFLHSCGFIYDIIDSVIDAGFDVLNPVQWSAGDRSYREWKDKARGRIVLWGGGVDSQHTLPIKTPAEISSEVEEVCEYLKVSNGFVFNNIHNILAEIEPEKVVAMFNSAK